MVNYRNYSLYRVDLLGGFRYFDLRERLNVGDLTTFPEDGNAGYAISDQFGTRNQFYGGQLGARPSTLGGNPNIKPETSTELEGGADFQFLGGRVALEATAFRKDVDDLILLASVPPSSGFTSKFVNGGKLQNAGTEFALDMTPISSWHDLTWTSRTSKYGGQASNAYDLTGLIKHVNQFAVEELAARVWRPIRPAPRAGRPRGSGNP